MGIRLWVFGLVWLGCGLFAEEPVLFNNVAVFDAVAGRLQPGCDVRVVGNRIVEVGPHQPTRHRDGLRVIDGRGKVLLPGLIDMHVHLPAVADEALVPQVMARHLRAGVTTLRSMRGAPAHLAWRARALAGAWPSPRWVLASPAIGRRLAATHTPEQLADQFGAAGYDFVKLLSGLNSDEYQRLSTRAAEYGLPVAGHLLADVSLDSVLAAKQRSIEHPEGLVRLLERDGEAGLRRFARAMRSRGMFFCPTLQWYHIRLELLQERLPHEIDAVPLSAEEAAAWRDFQKRVNDLRQDPEKGPEALAQRKTQWRAFRRVCRILNEENVPFLVSPGAGPFIADGRDMLLEMKRLHEMGLRRETVLTAATHHAAVALGLGDIVGHIAPGKRADLLLLDGNPLEDLNALQQVAAVMVDGRLLRRDLGQGNP